jgi:hypothetical protein
MGYLKLEDKKTVAAHTTAMVADLTKSKQQPLQTTSATYYYINKHRS